MSGPTEVPDDAPERPRGPGGPGGRRADSGPRADPGMGDAPVGPVGDPRDAWLRERGDELRWGGRLDVPDTDAEVPVGPAVPVGTEVEDPDGQTWAVEGDAHPIGERGVVLEPEPDPSAPAAERLGVREPDR